MDQEEIDRVLAEIGIVPAESRTVVPKALDEILGSRTHVRVLRVLVDVSDRINLSGRQVARVAGVARARALQVLRHLAVLRVVRVSWGTIHAVYRLADDHPLFPAICALMAAERAAAERARSASPPTGRT